VKTAGAPTAQPRPLPKEVTPICTYLPWLSWYTRGPPLSPCKSNERSISAGHPLFSVYIASADAAHGGDADFGAVDRGSEGFGAQRVADNGQLDVVQGRTDRGGS
jgi:hypothetical protein